MVNQWKSAPGKRQGWVAAALLIVSAGCGGGQTDRTQPAPPAGSAAPSLSPLLVSADPCAWIDPAKVGALLGRNLRGVPVRVASAESVTPSSTGAGCMYELEPEAGREPAMVSVEVKVDGAEMEAGLGAASLGDFSGSRGAWTAAWDWVSGLPAGLLAARQGHLGILIAINDLALTPARAEPLAAALLAAVPDRPFAIDAGDEAVAPTGPDPCALLTRAEVEAVVGPLAFPPFRSRESTPLVRQDGASCSYFGAGHRVVVVTPTWRDGRAVFDLSRGVAGLTRSVTGESDAASATGPWNAHAIGIAGTHYFLAGDRLIAIQRAGSKAGDSAAAALARVALPKMAP